MRLRALLFALIALGGTGLAAWELAGAATDYVERHTRAEVVEALGAAGQDWVDVGTDGMMITLTGTAPDETEHFRALELVRRVVDPGRVLDATELAQPGPLTPPPFALELLRNESEVSLIGLVPERSIGDEATADSIRAALAAEDIGASITDMLEKTEDAPPEGWRESLEFGLDILANLPRAKVSVAPGRVGVIAIADGPENKTALEARLAAAAPDGVGLSLDISAPRPVISPFTVEYALEGGKGRFLSCSADGPVGARSIMAAARATGLEDDTACSIGLGAPSPEWPKAVAEGFTALRELGGGQYAISNTEAVLTGAEGVDAEKFEAAASRLAAALPAGFSLRTVVPPRMEMQADGAVVHAPRFTAALGEDGTLALSGAVGDQTSRQAIESYAAALFGHGRVHNHTVIDPQIPDGWPGRVLAGIDALHAIKAGNVSVTADELAIAGWATSEDVQDKVEDILRDRVAKASVEVHFDAEAAEAEARAAALAAMSRPEICAEEVAAILETGSINFRAGSSEISPESRGVIAAIADVLRSCPGAQFEVAGYTDSQGRAEVNEELSENRAGAVQVALEEQDLPLIEFRARGYGAEYPVADNATAEGRQRNRRIELTLFKDAPKPVPLAPEACAARVAETLGEDSIQFNLGSADIAPESAETLLAIADVLHRCPGAAFEIAGHTDDQGAEDLNQRVSDERAQAVLEALQGAEIPGVTLTARGYGESEPIADNGTAEGRARNRRIELKLLVPAAEAAAGAEPVAVPGDGGDAPDTAAACQADIDALLEAETIQFGSDSAAIDGESADVIDDIAAALATCPGAGFEVAGHTDSVGGAGVNQRISEARAQAVLEALQARELPDITLTAKGYGQDRPIADNGTAEGRARNRRIEIKLVAPPPASAKVGAEAAVEVAAEERVSGAAGGPQ